MKQPLTWRYPFFAPELGDRARAIAATIEIPLGLEHRNRWDPDEDYWGESGAPAEPQLREILAVGPRESFELEQKRLGEGLDDDPILESLELAGRGERKKAREMLGGLLEEEPLCLDVYAHLGLFAYDYAAGLALPHYEAGVAVAELSLPANFAGLLPWGWIDNRPFLRCLHGYGLCLWRLNRFKEAEAVFTTLLWLDPEDNQGACELLKTAQARVGWKPEKRRSSEGGIQRGIGRRVLLDRASGFLETPTRATLADDEIRVSFEPLIWLLERALEDGLPLTQTGALGREIVREGALKFPDWWDPDLFGEPNREAEVALLESLDDFTRQAQLLRRRKSRLLLSAAARSALDEPRALIEFIAPFVISGNAFERELAELAAVTLLIEREIDRDKLTAIVYDALREDWRNEGTPLKQRVVVATLTPWLHKMIGLGPLTEGSDRQVLSLDEIGAQLIVESLRQSGV